MNSQDWEQFGEEIRRTVQNAVDSQDFRRLNQTITDTINQAVGSAAQGMRGFGEAMNRTAQNMGQRAGGPNMGPGRNAGYGGPNAGPGGNAGYGGPNAGPGGNAGYGGPNMGPGGNAGGGIYRGPGSFAGYSANGDRQFAGQAQQTALYKPTGGRNAGGVIMIVTGSAAGIPLLTFFLFTLIGGSMAGDAGTVIWQVLLVLFGLLTAGCGALVGAGISIVKKIGRFKKYVRRIGGREYCNIKELADSIGKPMKFVQKDVERMVNQRWFRQGRLDKKNTCLMLTGKAYEEYLRLEERMESQRREADAAKAQQERKEKEQQTAEQAKRSSLSPEVQKVIEQGDEYIRKIHAANDAIPGEEISAKIDRMEMLVDRIFDRVEESPDTVADIRKLMEYYLPTTIKLLDAYEQLDRQPVGGTNIETAKREIEATLDTLNTAFEKLLDDLFQDTAWDVSSDISVLNTILAQEGLTEDGLRK